jgi:single-strand DNA-binding protein
MNRVTLVGRLTKDPELRYMQSEKAVVNFTLAINRPFTNQNGEREADFINIVVWNKQAENAKQYISKGSKVAVCGRIQTRNYDDKDGKRVYITEIIADNIQFLDSKGQANKEVTPSNFEKEDTRVQDEPFADFGSNIEFKEM